MQAVKCDNCGVYADVPAKRVSESGHFFDHRSMPAGWLSVSWWWSGTGEGTGGVYCRVHCAAAALQRENAPPVGA